MKIPVPTDELLAALALLAALLSLAGLAQASARPDPQAHYEQVMRNSHLRVEDRITGEGFCWHAAYAADDFVNAYLAWGDAAWLERGAAYFDWLVDLMAEGPDGYRGWIGPYIYDEQYWGDAHVGDAILLNPMLRFAAVVLADSALSRTHGERARRYVALAERDLLEKWDRRNTWREDGPYGYYVSWDHFLTPGDWSTWQVRADARAGMSHPLNKQMDMGLAALRLYRITDKATHRERAERIFRLVRSRLRLFEGGYVWNYWEPLGPQDIDREAGRIRHWVNVHPTRNYQAREVAFMVEAYHSGLVFDRADMERLVRTNLENMWNGDLEWPLWRNAGLGGAWSPQPEGRAGALWSALADFDARARTLRARALKAGSIEHAFFHATVASRPPAFARRRAREEPAIAPLVLSPTRHLVMAAALPAAVARGEKALLVCKAAAGGLLDIALHRPGGERLRQLHAGPIAGGEDGLQGIFWIEWDTGEVPPGTYEVRWRLDGEERACPVEVRRGN